MELEGLDFEHDRIKLILGFIWEGRGVYGGKGGGVGWLGLIKALGNDHLVAGFQVDLFL